MGIPDDQGRFEDLWIAGKIATPGYTLSERPDDVLEEKLKTLGSRGKAAIGDLSGMQFEVLVKNGLSMNIMEDQIQCWRSAPDAFRTKFEADLKEHELKFQNLLTGLTFLQPTSRDPVPPPDLHTEPLALEDGEAVNEYDSIELLREKEKIVEECQCKVSGCTVFITESLKIFLCATKDRTIEPKTVLGGYVEKMGVPDDMLEGGRN